MYEKWSCDTYVVVQRKIWALSSVENLIIFDRRQHLRSNMRQIRPKTRRLDSGTKWQEIRSKIYWYSTEDYYIRSKTCPYSTEDRVVGYWKYVAQYSIEDIIIFDRRHHLRSNTCPDSTEDGFADFSAGISLRRIFERRCPYSTEDSSPDLRDIMRTLVITEMMRLENV
jgi:hypothetical protein